MCGIMENYYKNGGIDMKWNQLWMDLFGTTTLWGIDMGFWVAMAAVIMIVILMNAVFWGMKPQKVKESRKNS